MVEAANLPPMNASPTRTPTAAIEVRPHQPDPFFIGKCKLMIEMKIRKSGRRTDKREEEKRGRKREKRERKKRDK
jgi:hypothetical protein